MGAEEQKMDTVDQIDKYFEYAHLPPRLQAISAPFHEHIKGINKVIPPGAERSAGKRKLLEAKDCLVRAALAILLIFSCASCGNGGTGTPSTTSTTTTSTTSTTTTNNKPLILAAISTAAEIGTNQGLKALAKSKPTVATETANALKKSIDTVLLPYLRGGKIGTAEEVKILLNSSLFISVDPHIRDAIAAAAGILDAYLPAPGAGTILNQDQIDYISAFVSGISRGCSDFLPPEPGRVSRTAQKPRWIELAE